MLGPLFTLIKTYLKHIEYICMFPMRTVYHYLNIFEIRSLSYYIIDLTRKALTM